MFSEDCASLYNALSTPMATALPPTQTKQARPNSFKERVERFWQRVTEGMRAQRTLVAVPHRSPFQLSPLLEGRGLHPGREFAAAQALSTWSRSSSGRSSRSSRPARRVLLLIALVLVSFPDYRGALDETNEGGFSVVSIDSHFYGGLLMFALMILEVGDRVVMKRDLQIAKEIQSWLLPATPPPVPGLEIAFTTRPANTVAGDYYDVFARPCCEPDRPTFLLIIADVAGKSIPAAMLMATLQASLKTLSTTPGTLLDLVAPYESLRLHQQPERAPLQHRLYRRVRSREPSAHLRQRRTQQPHPSSQEWRNGAPRHRRHAAGHHGRRALCFGRRDPGERGLAGRPSPTASSKPRTTRRRNMVRSDS